MTARPKNSSKKDLGSQDKDYVLFSLEIIKNHRMPVDVGKLEALYQNDDDAIVEGALTTVLALGNGKQAPKIEALLQSSPKPEIQALCIRTLRHLSSDEDHGRAILPHMTSSNSGLCAEAIIYLLVKGNEDVVAEAEARVKQLEESGSPKDAALAAFIMGETGQERYLPSLRNMLDSSVPVVKRAAVIAAGKMRSPDLLTGLIDALGDKDVSVLARKAVAGHGTPAVPSLTRAYERSGDDLQLRLEIVKTLGRIPCPESAEALTDVLLSDQRQLSYYALRALGNMREVIHDVRDFKDRIFDSLKKEAERGRRALTLLGIVNSETDGAGQYIEGGSGLLADEITHRLSQTKVGIFGRLGLVYDYKLIYKAYLNYMGGHKSHRAASLELLENVVDKDLSRMFLPLLEHVPLEATMPGIENRTGA